MVAVISCSCQCTLRHKCCSQRKTFVNHLGRWEVCDVINPFTVKCGQRQISSKVSKFHFLKFWQIAECDSTGRELSFEWSHHRISSTDSKVRVILQNSIKHSGSERVKGAMTRGYCCSRSILFRSSQLLFKLTQSINTIERFEYNKKDCEEGKEIFQF